MRRKNIFHKTSIKIISNNVLKLLRWTIKKRKLKNRRILENVPKSNQLPSRLFNFIFKKVQVKKVANQIMQIILKKQAIFNIYSPDLMLYYCVVYYFSIEEYVTKLMHTSYEYVVKLPLISI